MRIHHVFANRSNIGDCLSARGIQRLLGELDADLEVQLHGCVISIAMGRPVIAVSGDRKVEAFMEAAGLGAWTLRQDRVALLPELLAALAGQPPTANVVEEALAANRRLSASVIDLAAGARSRRVRSLA